MTNHDHRLAADLHRPVVADSRHLALVPDVGPHLVEDALHLELENRRIGIDAAVNAIGLHRLGDIQADIRSHRDLPSSHPSKQSRAAPRYWRSGRNYARRNSSTTLHSVSPQIVQALLRARE